MNPCFLHCIILKSLQDLPDYNEIMRRLVEYSNYNIQTEGLYRERVIGDKFEDENDEELDEMMSMDEIPEFLQGEDLQKVSGNGDEYVEREAASAVVEDDVKEPEEDSEDIVT